MAHASFYDTHASGISDRTFQHDCQSVRLTSELPIAPIVAFVSCNDSSGPLPWYLRTFFLAAGQIGPSRHMSTQDFPDDETEFCRPVSQSNHTWRGEFVVSLDSVG